MTLDHKGVVQQVSKTPMSTFGFEPEQLVKKSIGDFVDIFQAASGGAGGVFRGGSHAWRWC